MFFTKFWGVFHHYLFKDIVSFPFFLSVTQITCMLDFVNTVSQSLQLCFFSIFFHLDILWSIFMFEVFFFLLSFLFCFSIHPLIFSFNFRSCIFQLWNLAYYVFHFSLRISIFVFIGSAYSFTLLVTVIISIIAALKTLYDDFNLWIISIFLSVLFWFFSLRMGLFFFSLYFK